MKTTLAIIGSMLVLSGTANAQDLTFLPLVLERAALDTDQNMGRRHGVIYVDVPSILTAVNAIGFSHTDHQSVTAVLRAPRNRPFVPVDSIGEVVERGPVSSPAYQRIASHFPRTSPVLDVDGMVRWIREDGVHLRVQNFRPWSGGYTLTVFPSSTYPRFTGIHGRPTTYYVQRLPTGWTIVEAPKS